MTRYPEDKWWILAIIFAGLMMVSAGCTRAQQFDYGMKKGEHDALRNRIEAYVAGYKLGQKIGEEKLEKLILRGK